MFKLATHLFFKKFYNMLIVIIEIAFFLCTLVSGSIEVENHYNKIKFYKNIPQNVITCFFPYENDKEMIDYTLLNENDCILEFATKPIQSKDTTIYSFEENTFEIYKNYLVKGNLPKPNNQKIECLSTKRNMLGKTITKTIKNKNYEFYVTGIVKKDVVFLTNGHISDTSTLREILTNLESKNALMCNYEDVKDLTNKTKQAFLFYQNELSSNVKNNIEYSGYIIDLNYAFECYKQNFFYNENFINTFLALALCIISIISMVILLRINIDLNRNIFDTFYNVGLSKANLFKLSLWYNLFFILFLLPISFDVMIFVDMHFILDNKITLLSGILAVSVYMLISVIHILFFNVFLRPKQISDKVKF